jgi:membrane protein implicated in regulation of membrane protease activity
MNMIKNLALAGLLMTTSFATVQAAGPVPAGSGQGVSGEVLEVKDVEAYTYLRLKTKDGETWAAVNKTPVKKGAQVSVENPMVMSDFESKSLKKTFKTIVFGSLAGSAAGLPVVPTKAIDLGPIKVAKASGANAYTVAEVVGKALELKDKPVKLSGKVVKYNPEIMGKNWIHLQDGSGSAAAKSNDILVTSSATTQVGEVITVSGLVRNDKDFGAGYSYKVLIEDASVTKP